MVKKKTLTPVAINYPRPPITEAVIGITFKAAPSETVLKDAATKFRINYDRYDEEVHVGIGVEFKDGKQPSHKTLPTIRGFKLTSNDATEIALMRPTGLSISQLAPYPGWDDFFDRFMRDWKVWKSVVGFREIARVGVRYINRIDIPATAEVVHHEHFLEIYPYVPDIFGPLTQYAVQTQSIIQDLKLTLTVNSGVVPSPILNTMSVLLDFDFARNLDPPQSDDDLFALLVNIRSKKNEFFEACVTSKSRELFKK